LRRALVTGITGQDGQYLAELLLGKGYGVFGMVRGQRNPNVDQLKRDLPEVDLISGDLLDDVSLARALERSAPDEVYNLGGVSFVQYSFEHPLLTSQVTGVGPLKILEAIRSLGASRQVRFYQASSSEMFGLVQHTPQNETTSFHPRSPYAAAKAFAHHMTVNYRESYGLFAVGGILFNHESPRRGLEFVTRKITHHAAAIKLGLLNNLELGSLDAQRDWGFAGDYVRAMYLMLQSPKPYDYVVGTGVMHSVRDFVEAAFGHVGLDWTRYVVQNEQFMRPAEVTQLCADPARARTELGWKPQVQFTELVAMMVEHDLQRLSRP
jgi:GDPmannose 4,6-dehydratase